MHKISGGRGKIELDERPSSVSPSQLPPPPSPPPGLQLDLRDGGAEIEEKERLREGDSAKII